MDLLASVLDIAVVLHWHGQKPLHCSCCSGQWSECAFVVFGRWQVGDLYDLNVLFPPGPDVDDDEDGGGGSGPTRRYTPGHGARGDGRDGEGLEYGDMLGCSALIRVDVGTSPAPSSDGHGDGGAQKAGQSSTDLDAAILPAAGMFDDEGGHVASFPAKLSSATSSLSSSHSLQQALLASDALGLGGPPSSSLSSSSQAPHDVPALQLSVRQEASEQSTGASVAQQAHAHAVQHQQQLRVREQQAHRLLLGQGGEASSLRLGRRMGLGGAQQASRAAPTSSSAGSGHSDDGGSSGKGSSAAGGDPVLKPPRVPFWAGHATWRPYYAMRRTWKVRWWEVAARALPCPRGAPSLCPGDFNWFGKGDLVVRVCVCVCVCVCVWRGGDVNDQNDPSI
jgi:hypothetical protein